MIGQEDMCVAWDAPIVPGFSLAGIPLHMDAADLETELSRYLVEGRRLRYRFEGAPDLHLSNFGLDEHGNGGYSFSIFESEVVGELRWGTPALSILVESGKVYAIKAYDFSFPGEPAHGLVYKGRLSGNIGLGSPLSEVLSLTSLEFDDAEEWFYTSCDYGVLEVSGWGCSLDDEPNQLITAICVISA